MEINLLRLVSDISINTATQTIFRGGTTRQKCIFKEAEKDYWTKKHTKEWKMISWIILFKSYV